MAIAIWCTRCDNAGDNFDVTIAGNSLVFECQNCSINDHWTNDSQSADILLVCTRCENTYSFDIDIYGNTIFLECNDCNMTDKWE